MAQTPLPDISIKNYNGLVVISWKNEYVKPVTTINIQRSYDSLKNYTTVGSVLSPLNQENGYADSKPPYNKMYYRLFISFEGGEYLFSAIKRPVKDTASVPVRTDFSDLPPVTNDQTTSRKIYSGKENNIIIDLPDAANKKYLVKFFDEKNSMILELKKITEPYLILERVNFVHSGWFRYELFENGRLLDKNRVYVFKDAKTQQVPLDEKGKN